MIVYAAYLSALLSHGVTDASLEARPPLWIESFEWKSNVGSDPVRPIQFGALRVSLETTTLDSVRKLVGAGIIYHNGDASESLAWICYRFTQDGIDQTVWFSSSELGGGEVIDGLTVAQSGVKSDKCTALPRGFTPARLDKGIWLGSDQNRVIKAFGEPRKSNDRWGYVFRGRAGEYDVSSALGVEVRDGRVVGIALSRATTN